MRKRSQQFYICLTLFKQNIEELVQLFQENMQEVEIAIDGLPLLDRAQFDQYPSTYQASTLLARGYYDGVGKADRDDQERRVLIELKMEKTSAVLQVWKEKSQQEPEVLTHIRKVFWRCQNRAHQFVIMVGNWLLVYLYLALLPHLQQHRTPFVLQLVLLVGIGVVMMVLAFLLSTFLVRLLKMETLVFLFPGRERTSRVYGRREVIGRLIVILGVLVVFNVCVAVGFYFLWR